MSVLRFRDSATNEWKEITTIVGPAGKDYVLTEADKEEIAGMVEVSGGSDADVSVDGVTIVKSSSGVLSTAADIRKGTGADSTTIGLASASGIGSIGIGEGAMASGTSSVAIGPGVKATGDAQFAIGKYSAEDASKAFIIGNGQPGSPANAMTIGTDNTAWFAGDVTTGADNKKLATETYVNEAIANIDIPGGGGGSGSAVEEVHVGTEAPEDANIKIWVDTDETSNFPSAEEIINTVVPDAMNAYRIASPNRKDTVILGYKGYNYSDMRSIISDQMAYASSMEEFINYLKLGLFVVPGGNAAGVDFDATWLQSQGWNSSMYDVNTESESTSGSFSSARFYFLYGNTVHRCRSATIPNTLASYFNQIPYDGTKHGIASFTIPYVLDEFISNVGNYVKLTSPNGTQFKLSVADDGTLSAVQA